MGTSMPVQRLVTGEYKHPFILQPDDVYTGESVGGGGTGAGARAGACVAVADVADDGVRRHGIFVVRSESFVRQWHGHRPFVA